MNRETRNVEAEVRKQFERLDPETKPTIFIGFSGGLDSLALLVALVRVVGDRHKLICLHADHGIVRIQPTGLPIVKKFVSRFPCS